MNWITRCPECATVYQVAPDQLQLGKGWLRCGQCQHVFDSTGLLLAGAAVPSVAAGQETDGASTQRLAIEDLLKQEDRSIAHTPSMAAVDLASFEEALSTFKPEIEKSMAELVSTPLAVEASAALDVPPGPKSKEAPLPQGPSVWWIWVLLVSFLLQWLWIERHAVSALWPVMDSPFKAVCRAVSCETEFLRDPDAVVIDSSSFIQRDEDHELSWTVRNAGKQALAMPALELTLQDVQGKAVVRRVLMPAEVGAPRSCGRGRFGQVGCSCA